MAGGPVFNFTLGDKGLILAGSLFMSRTMRNQMVGTVATVDTAPVQAGTVGQYSWPQAMSPVILSNNTTKDCYVIINDPSGAPSVTSNTLVVVTGEKIDLSFGERVSVRYVSVKMAADATEEQFQLTGWDLSG